MATMLYWIVMMSIIAGLAVATVFAVRAYMSGQSPAELFFRPRAEPRLGVIEYANMDGKRKLVLIRRDDVEHLIMTGGPVDVVVETGIGEKKQPARFSEATEPAPAATVFTRPPRTFGQASGGGEAS